jgi:cytochrome c peroxidase
MLRVVCLLLAPFSIAMTSVRCSAGTAENMKTFRLPREVPAPANNKVTPERTYLGKMLFFDPRLSGSKRISCATCHNPGLGWSDGLPTALGHDGAVLKRATPTIVNAAFGELQMWDGRFHNLEEQALAPMQASAEMNGSMQQILARLRAIPGYSKAFDTAYPGEGITEATLAKAIASFERTIISKNSPFDRWVAGDRNAINRAAKHGFELFTGKAQCVNCHQAPYFTDQGFHNIGLKDNQDPGRYAKVPVKAMQGAFKTPTLRDVALTAPYMHNGAYRDLRDVIEHYDRGGDAKENLDPNIKPLGLTGAEKDDLLAFLQTLTGKQIIVTLPRLPQ